jgi:hypothetical protein
MFPLFVFASLTRVLAEKEQAALGWDRVWGLVPEVEIFGRQVPFCLNLGVPVQNVESRQAGCCRMIVDMELIDDEAYAAMGEKLTERLRILLSKLDTIRRNQDRGYDVNEEIINTSNKFIGRVEAIFRNLPKILEWLSFLHNDLSILMDTSLEVREASDRHRLNKSQIQTLENASAISAESFQTSKNYDVMEVPLFILKST